MSSQPSVEEILEFFSSENQARRSARTAAFLDEVRRAQTKRRLDERPAVSSWEIVTDGDRVVLRTPDGRRWRVSRRTALALAAKLQEKANVD